MISAANTIFGVKSCKKIAKGLRRKKSGNRPAGAFWADKKCILIRKIVPQGPFGRIKMYFEPENQSAGAFWADEHVF